MEMSASAARPSTESVQPFRTADRMPSAIPAAQASTVATMATPTV